VSKRFLKKLVSKHFLKRLWNLGVVILLNNLARCILNFKLVAINYKYINYFTTYGPKTKKPPIYVRQYESLLTSKNVYSTPKKVAKLKLLFD
jgi:hypothetical protein